MMMQPYGLTLQHKNIYAMKEIAEIIKENRYMLIIATLGITVVCLQLRSIL